MTPTDAAWLAGFLDGEGSFMVAKSWHLGCSAPTYAAVVGASNTDKSLLLKCQSIAGGKIVTTAAKSARWKDAHHWQIKGRSVEPLVRSVLPYLVGKRRQAELLLKLRALTHLGSKPGCFSTRKTPAEVAERADIHALVKALNARGGPSINPEYAAMAERRINGDRGGLLDLMEAAQ